MDLEASSISCGVDQLFGLEHSPKTIVQDLAQEIVDHQEWYEDRPPAFLVFSDAVNFKNGRKLASYIKKNNLGALYGTQPKTNNNSGNKIQVWTWSVDWPAVIKLAGVKARTREDTYYRW